MSMMSAMSAMSAPAPLCPDKRGGRRCICHGTFVSMTRGSGWIKPIEEINHPSASWNQGDVYLSEKDVLPGVTLEAGDSVVFHLYVDAKGLGAQNCVPVWHERAQAMRATRSANEISLAQSAFVPSATEIAIASAFLTASAILQAPVVTTKPPPGLTVNNLAVDLSSFYDDDDDEEDDEEESDAGDTTAIKIRLADVLPALELPSLGSALHAEGNCKRCSFFPKGTCTNAAECEFCHFDHEKRPQNHKRKRLWRERQREKAQLARVEAERAAALRTPLKETMKIVEEPMKISLSSISKPKQLFSTASGIRTPMTSTDEGSADEGYAPGSPKSSGDEGSTDNSYRGSVRDSSSTTEREPRLTSGVFMPPAGLTPPPPSFPPPPMPEHLSAVQ